MAEKKPVALYAGELKELQAGDTLPWVGAGDGALRKVQYLIDTITIETAGAISFSSIAADYDDLIIEVVGRSASTTGGIDVFFNDDTTAANYKRQYLQANNAAASAASAADGVVLFASVSTVNSNEFARMTASIKNYTSANYKNADGQSYARHTGTNSSIIRQNAVTWLNTAAITKITLGDSTSHFDVGSIIKLYGVKDDYGSVGAVPNIDKGNILLNAFRIAVNGSLSVQNMIDGFVDVYTDETGVNNVDSLFEEFSTDKYIVTRAASYPAAHTDANVKATSDNGSSLRPYFATDPALSLIGSDSNTSWMATASTNQRFHIKYADKIIAKVCNYDNYHASGGSTNKGAKTFTLWGSNDAAAFANLTYGTDTNWTQITTSVSTLDEHTASDVSDTKTFTLTNTVEYSYYAFKFADNHGNGTRLALRHIELATLPEFCILHSESFTAISQPETSYLVLHEEDVDSITINTDLVAFVTRCDSLVYTTDYLTDNKLDITGHGFINGDTVFILDNGTTMPDGLVGTTKYFVINKTTNDFELSLTSGGSAITLLDNGTGTLKLVQVVESTLAIATSLDAGNIYTATTDLSSLQTGTSMKYLLLIKNFKQLNIHAAGLTWD